MHLQAANSLAAHRGIEFMSSNESAQVLNLPCHQQEQESWNRPLRDSSGSQPMTTRGHAGLLTTHSSVDRANAQSHLKWLSYRQLHRLA